MYGVVKVRGGSPQPPDPPLAPLLAPLLPLDAPLLPLDAPLLPLEVELLLPLAPLEPELLAPSSREIRSDPTVAPPHATESSAEAGAAAAIEKRSLGSEEDLMPRAEQSMCRRRTLAFAELSGM